MSATATSSNSRIGDIERLLQLSDTNIWEEYEDMISTVKNKVKMGKGKKGKDENYDPSIEYLLSKELMVEPLNCEDKISEGTIKEQRQRFRIMTNLTYLQYEYTTKVLTYMGHYCAKLQRPKHLAIAWYKFLESGMPPYQPTINTYMYVLSLDETTMHLSGEAAAYHDEIFDPNETSITIRINSLIKVEDALGAELLLEKVPSNDLRRLRTYLPILHYYCNKGDMNAVLRLYRQMRLSSGVHFDADTYAATIGSIASNGGFSNNGNTIDAAKIAGFSTTHGPELFNEMAQEMADDILELTNSSARILYNSFLSGFREYFPSSLKSVSSDLEITKSSECAQINENILSRVSVNRSTAICPRSGARLKLYKLEPTAREHMFKTLFTMAKEQYEEYHAKINPKKRKSPQDSSYVVNELDKFCRWVEEHGPFTAIIDGANVGYYNHGKIHYSQIRHIMKKLEEMKETPLVVMPLKYTRPNFYASRGFYQQLDKDSLEFIEKIKKENKLYIVAPGCLDDYYWMISPVIGDELSAVNDSGRFPGNRPMLITNDKMRDHKLELLEPRLFRRWQSCHIVNYDFPERMDLEKEWEDRKVELFTADLFSHEIQGNPSGDEKDPGSKCWHFPVEGWDKHNRLCIRIV